MNIAKISQQKAEKLESLYVHHVYSSQASSFEDLCDGPWPKIRSFLTNLSRGSFVADVGCGNGKYLNVRDDIVIHGSDICQELTYLAYKRQKDVIRANNLCLPYRSAVMDAVISVGVLHHLSTPQRRYQSITELTRILRPGGKMLIYVLALEQKQRKFKGQDVLIPWSRGDMERCNSTKQDSSCKNLSFTSRGQVTNAVVHDRVSNSLEEDGEKYMSKVAFSCSASTHLNESSRISRVAINDEVLTDCNEIKISQFSSLKKCAAVTKKLRCFPPDLNSPRALDSIPAKTRDSNALENYNCHSHKRTEQRVNFSKNELCISNSDINGMRFDRATQNPKKKHHDNASKLLEAETWNYQDLAEPFHCPSFQRFYHVFKEGELVHIVKRVPGLKILCQYYDHGNWAVIVEKQ